MPIRSGSVSRQRLGERDGVAVIADLLPGIDFLPRLAVAGAEVPVVEHQRAEPGVGERLGEPIEIHLLHG